MNYLIIGIIVFVLGCTASYAWYQHTKLPKEEKWFLLALACWTLEVKARAARDLKRMLDRLKRKPKEENE